MTKIEVNHSTIQAKSALPNDCKESGTQKQCKIYIINSSPRKGQNTDKMCQSFKKGVEEKGGEARIVYLNNLNFKGCRECFACKLKNGKNYGKCAFSDELTSILNDISHSDGIAFATPIFFGDVSGVMKSFTERLLFPNIRYDKDFTSIAPKKLRTAVIYTMNVTKEIFENDYLRANNSGPIGLFESWIEKIYRKPERICGYNTYQFSDYSKYDAEIWDVNNKEWQRQNIFPKELKSAYEAGKQMASM